jgi:hypothetical protein
LYALSWSFKNQYAYEVFFLCLKNGPLVMAVRLKIEENIRTAAILLLQILNKMSENCVFVEAHIIIKHIRPHIKWS